MKKITLYLLIVLNLNFIAQNSNNLVNGVFMVEQTKYYDASGCDFNNIRTVNNIAAYFTYTATVNITPNLFSKAGNVKFNNDPLDYNINKKFYSETEVCSINKQNWKVSGHSTIPNMNFIFNGILPSFDISQNLLNDTLRKNDTLFLHLDNIQNADSIMINISDNNLQSSPNHIALLAPNYSNIYYLPPALFIPLTVSPKAIISIEAIKYSYQTIAGKRFLFRNIYSFVKTNVKIIN